MEKLFTYQDQSHRAISTVKETVTSSAEQSTESHHIPSTCLAGDPGEKVSFQREGFQTGTPILLK